MTPASLTAMKEGSLAAPAGAVVVMKWVGLSLPEWAALAALVYTVLITVRLIVYTLSDFGFITLPAKKKKVLPRKRSGIPLDADENIVKR